MHPFRKPAVLEIKGSFLDNIREKVFLNLHKKKKKLKWS